MDQAHKPGRVTSSDKKAKKLCNCAEILIVDDNGLNIYALEILLENFGYKSDYATDGKMAIDEINKQKYKGCGCHYQLVLMDLNMPVMDGRMAQSLLKQQMDAGELRPFRIVACTGAVTQQEVRRTIEAGFHDIIAKPISNEDLLRVLREHY